MSRGSVYAVIFGLLAIAVAIVATVFVHRQLHGSSNDSGDSKKATVKTEERFTDSVQPAAAASSTNSGGGGGSNDSDDVAVSRSSDTYHARMSVMQTFTDVVGRKASKDEIERYSSLGSDAAIRSAIERDMVPAGPYDERFSEVPSTGEGSGNGKGKSNNDGKRKTFKKDRDSDSDSDSDEESDKVDRPRRSSSHDPSHEPEPYSRLNVTKDTAAEPDLGWTRKGRGSTSDRTQICMNRRDVLKRLQTIADEVERFRQTVMMM